MEKSLPPPGEEGEGGRRRELDGVCEGEGGGNSIPGFAFSHTPFFPPPPTRHDPISVAECSLRSLGSSFILFVVFF